MKSVPPLDPEAEDPWTYFGSFSRVEVDAAAALLRDSGLVYEIHEEKQKQEVFPAGGWTGPFALWIRDEHAGLASSLLVPFFAEKKEPNQSSQPTRYARG
jgi:hypothetical protein